MESFKTSILISLGFFLLFCLPTYGDSEFTPENYVQSRTGKMLNVFNIVRFTNGPCASTDGRNGTCYLADQCATRGGRSSGTCASGYGVCCLFERGCGASSSENCTFFSSTATNGATNPGTCELEICPCSDNICQLRLDFMQFTITGPSTNQAQIGNALCDNLVNGVNPGKATPNNPNGGQPIGRGVTDQGRCLTDTFTVTNPGGCPSDVICGQNTGEHLYIDANEDCNDLVFQLGTEGVGATVPTRAWNIKVTQYACDFNNLAPKGCDQYFFGSNTGTFETYNFDGGQHLANQDQVFCFRREAANCRICFAEVNDNVDFELSGMTVEKNVPGANEGLNDPDVCGNYGGDCLDTNGFDFFSIPSAVDVNNNRVNSRICGQRLIAEVGIGAANSQTVCSTSTPFLARFNSDTFENFNVENGNQGLMLAYIQDATNCAAPTG